MPFMSYQTYITEAFVCGSWHSNTADKSILLFAREAGMVYVQAKSVREERSKQRYALQDVSHIRATLIRGKTGWKVAGAEALHNLYGEAKSRKERGFLRDTILLLRRVMQGETPHQHIFDDIKSVFIGKNYEYSDGIQSVLHMRILNALGYVAPKESWRDLLDGEFPFKQSVLLDISTITELNQSIENALIQSQL